MKITETTPKVERTFNVELTEQELNTVYLALILSDNAGLEHASQCLGLRMMTAREFTDFYSILRTQVLNSGKEAV